MKKIISFIFFLLVIACKKKDCEPCNENITYSNPENIIGSWLQYDTIYKDVSQLIFQNDTNKIYIYKIKGGREETGGNYNIVNGRLFINDTVCGSVIGLYNIVFPSPNKLRITVFSDTCEYARKLAFSGVWIKE